MKIAIITSGYMPVPATKGGAVETLVENILYEKEKRVDNNEFYIFTDFDIKAKQKSEKYKKSKFIWIKTPKILKMMDCIIFNICTTILRKKKNISYRYIIKRLYYIGKVSKMIKKYDYDKIVIENNATLFSILKLRKNYKKYANKYYYHVHNEVIQTFGNTEMLKNTRKIIGISNYINKTIIQKIPEIKKKQTTVLKNCIDLERVDKNAYYENKEKLGINKNDIKIIFVGRLSEEKGIKELINAIIKLNNPKIKLIVVGKSFYDTKVISSFEKELIDVSEKIKDKIIFTGYIEHDKIYDMYRFADIVVLPSIWQEPAGLTIVEAAAVGVPLITTDVGGIREYIDGKSAIFVKNDDKVVDHIKEAIQKILKDKNLKNVFLENSKKIQEEYSIKKYYDNFIKILEEK